jgi:hypothetical protein
MVEMNNVAQQLGEIFTRPAGVLLSVGGGIGT